jgi:hypothetical protein
MACHVAGMKIKQLPVDERITRMRPWGREDATRNVCDTSCPTMIVPTLSDAEVQRFIADGFVKVESAFPRELAKEARAIFWKDLSAHGRRPDEPTTWTRPVIRLGMYEHAPIVAAANTPRLHSAFDQLVGP